MDVGERVLDDEYIIGSSEDNEPTHLGHLRQEVDTIKENLDQDLKEANIDIQAEEVEVEELIEAEDDCRKGDLVAWVNWDFRIYFPESTIDEIGREEPSVNRTKQGNIRHEYAHLVDLHFNSNEYDSVKPESSRDIKNAPKEAYAIFEELRVSSDHDGGYPFLRGYRAAPHWHSFVEIDSCGRLNWIENNDSNADYSVPHTLGYYAAKTLEEAENKKNSDRKEAEKTVRKRLLQTTTVDGLMSEISKAHEKLGQPFYLEILDEVSSQVTEMDEELAERRLNQKKEKYEDKSDIGLEEYYQDHAFLESSKSIFEENLEYKLVSLGSISREKPDCNLSQAIEDLDRSLTGYGDSRAYDSENIMIDEGSGTSEEYLDWLPN